jgi:hypothetical protein
MKFSELNAVIAPDSVTSTFNIFFPFKYCNTIGSYNQVTGGKAPESHKGDHNGSTSLSYPQ